MTGAKDPDEYILKYGPERFKKLMDNSISYAEYKINRLKANYDLNDTTEKIQFLTKMAEVLSKIENNIERDVYVEKFSMELGVGKEAILAEIEKKTLRSANVNKQGNTVSQSFLGQNQTVNQTSHSNEDLMIYLLSKKEDVIYQKLKNNIDVSDIEDRIRRNIIVKLYDLYETGNINNKTIDSACESDEELSALTGILMNERINGDTDKVLSEVIKSFQMEKLTKKKNALITKLSSASTNEERESIAIELNEINRQLMIR